MAGARIGCSGTRGRARGAESAPEPSNRKPPTGSSRSEAVLQTCRDRGLEAVSPAPGRRGTKSSFRAPSSSIEAPTRPARRPGGRRAPVSPPAMGSAALEILGLVLCLVGWVGLILACGLPMWQVTAFLDHNIVTAQTTWKGLWMSCVVQSTGHMQCKVYDSVLALSTEVQAARALTVGAVLLALVALFVTLAGAQCTTCVAPGPAKARVALTGGVLYALCGLLALVPLCWFANIVVREFYDPTVPMSQKYELGAALYIGWAASALLMCGGGLVCCGAWVCAGRPDFSFPVKYSASRRPTATGDYDKKNYV
ncbi:claudin-5 [Zalophus californianus]|uniref:Claudin-5 n=1 Tax=Zalophus californianus TaxID=9704 RepID=A0A6J2BTZ0_ZALCA|nr:claudin-5 [Zalophus californianus]